jgi:polysaccharide biosynthesis/export protein
MRHVRLAVLILAVLMVAGCARFLGPSSVAPPGPGPIADGGPPPGPGPGPVAVGPPPGPPPLPPVALVGGAPLPPFTLDSGDRLRIVVFGQDNITNSYAVGASGNITMPLIGAVRARGLTPSELSQVIASRLRQGYLRDPHVAVEVELYRPFFILGEVQFPGQYPYVPNMTAETAVAIAGGFTPRAWRPTVQLSRPVDGATARQLVPVITQMNPGDTIVVDERWF